MADVVRLSEVEELSRTSVLYRGMRSTVLGSAHSESASCHRPRSDDLRREQARSVSFIKSGEQGHQGHSMARSTRRRTGTVSGQRRRHYIDSETVHYAECA